MMPSRPYRNHLRFSDDLVTTYEATRAGFVALALEKNRRATPYVAEARALQEAASKARTPADLLDHQGHRIGPSYGGRVVRQGSCSSAARR